MSPRREEHNEALRAETRAKIMEAALTLFGERGYEGTTIAQIANAAGVAQGLMYRHFASKEHLLAAIFAQSIAEVRASFAAAEASGSPEERIGALIHSAFATVRHNLRFWKLSYASRNQIPVLHALGTDVTSWTNEILATLEGYFRATGWPNPQLEAAILFATIDGISQHYALNPAHYPLDAIEHALTQKYQRAPTANH
jgi:AcrR family transcriptional regulator